MPGTPSPSPSPSTYLTFAAIQPCTRIASRLLKRNSISRTFLGLAERWFIFIPSLSWHIPADTGIRSILVLLSLPFSSPPPPPSVKYIPYSLSIVPLFAVAGARLWPEFLWKQVPPVTSEARTDSNPGVNLDASREGRITGVTTSIP